jgi:hypothetical protein
MFLNQGRRRKMKRKILQLIPILAILIAVAGYGYTGNAEVYRSKEKNRHSKHDDNKMYSSDKSCCEPCNSCRACEICPPCEPCKPCCTEVSKIGEPCNCAYNAPARIDPACGWKAWMTLSFIYWEPMEKGLDLGIIHLDESSGTLGGTNYHSIITFDFDYHPGFKIGGGWSSCRDDWTLYLEYTRLKSEDSETKDITSNYNSDTHYITSPWVEHPSFTSESLNYIKGKWELNYNTLDLELGRPYYVGKKVIFRPQIGLRGGWIDQKFDVNAIDSGTEHIKLRGKQDSWLIGPRAGLGSCWLVGCNFRIFFNAAASLTYQKFDNSIKQSFVESSFKTNAKGEDSNLTPIAELGLGLGYGRYFCNNQWHFDLTVGYDFNYLWDQNQIENLSSILGLGHSGDSNGDLMLHGLTITGRIDF